MNKEIRLLVRIENTPSNEQQKKILSDIESFLLKIDSAASLRINTGEGSWWIEISIWVGERFLGWLANRGFNKIADKAKEKRIESRDVNIPEVEDAPKKENVTLSNETAPDLAATGAAQYAALYREMSDLLDIIEKSTDGTGKAKVVFGNFDSSSERGRVASLEKDGDDITFSIVQTDSPDDYNNLTKS